MNDKTYEAKLFERIAELTRTPEQNAERFQAMAESVRGMPLDDWPAEWTVGTIIPVALAAKIPGPDVVRFLRGKYPDSFSD